MIVRIVAELVASDGTTEIGSDIGLALSVNKLFPLFFFFYHFLNRVINVKDEPDTGFFDYMRTREEEFKRYLEGEITFEEYLQAWDREFEKAVSPKP